MPHLQDFVMGESVDCDKSGDCLQQRRAAFEAYPRLFRQADRKPCMSTLLDDVTAPTVTATSASRLRAAMAAVDPPPFDRQLSLSLHAGG